MAYAQREMRRGLKPQQAPQRLFALAGSANQLRARRLEKTGAAEPAASARALLAEPTLGPV